MASIARDRGVGASALTAAHFLLLYAAMLVAAAGNTEVMRAKAKTMRSLGLNDVIEDILITLGKQYHLIRPSSRKEGAFVYFVLEKSKSNLALARRKMQETDKNLTF